MVCRRHRKSSCPKWIIWTKRNRMPTSRVKNSCHSSKTPYLMASRTYFKVICRLPCPRQHLVFKAHMVHMAHMAHPAYTTIEGQWVDLMILNEPLCWANSTLNNLLQIEWCEEATNGVSRFAITSVWRKTKYAATTSRSDKKSELA